MARSNAALAAPKAPTPPDPTTAVAGAMRKPPASMLTPTASPPQPTQPESSGAARFPQPGDPIPGWVHQLGADVANDFQDFVEYIKTASPQEQQEIALEFGIVAASFLPGASDAIGVGADLAGLRHEENRNAVYLGLTLLGAVPFVPPFNRIRKTKRLIRTGAEKWRRRKGMRRANQNPPANVPANQFDDVASARNVDLDPDLLVVQARELGRDAANSVTNGLSGVIANYRRAIWNGLKDAFTDRNRVTEIAAEAITAVGIQALTRGFLGIEEKLEGWEIEAAEGGISGLIGSSEYNSVQQFFFELMNIVAFELMRGSRDAIGRGFLSSLNQTLIITIESALAEGAQAGVRLAFDRVERSQLGQIKRALLSVAKQGASAGAEVGVVAGFRYALGSLSSEGDYTESFSEAAVDATRDIYRRRRN